MVLKLNLYLFVLVGLLVAGCVEEYPNKNDFFYIGENLVLNNMWGEYKLLPGETYTQAIYIQDNKMPIGWKWECLTSEPGVKGFPQIYFGTNPYFKKSTTDKIPAKIADIEYLKMVHDVTYKADGKYNVAYDIWVTDSEISIKENIVHEVMIWLVDEMPPSQGFVGEVRIGFGVYDFYHYEHRAGHGFSMFVAKDANVLPQAIMPIDAFVKYLVDSDYMSDEFYISCIELGSEMWDGTGVVAVHRFDALFKEKE